MESEEILVQKPWQCHENDCNADGTWHMASYWCHPGGEFSVDLFTDGDHEDIEGGGIPSWEDVEEAEQEYFRWVAKAGRDPLHQVSRCCSRPRERVWQVQIRNMIGRPRIMRGRLNGRGEWVGVNSLPGYVLEYLEAQQEGFGWAYPRTWEDLREEAGANPDVKVQTIRGIAGQIWMKLLIRVTEPYPQPTPSAIRQEARRVLKQK